MASDARRPRTKRPAPAADAGPTLRAAPFQAMAHSEAAPLLSAEQRQQLAAIATRVQVPARAILYREETPATALFINADGVVKAFRDLPSGRRFVTAFLYPDDVFGLAENGLYLRTAQAVTAAALFRFEFDQLLPVLRRDPELQFQFLCKVTHELRESQRQTITIGRRDAVGRVVMFLRQVERDSGAPSCRFCEIELPMSRSDIASYLGLSLEAVSRACRTLESLGIVSFPNRHLARIMDPVRFERIESTA